MNDGKFALVEMLFAFGVVLAIAFWQLWGVRASKIRGDQEDENRQDQDESSS